MKVVEKMLDWENAGKMNLLSVGYSLREPQLLFRKIEDEEIAFQIEKLKSGAMQIPAEQEKPQPKVEAVNELKAEIVYDDFMNEKEHEEMKLNEKSGIKYTRKTKMEFMEYFIRTKIYAECKVILCSSYIRIFNDIKKLLNSYNIKYKELDDGNIYSISNSINEYNYGNINVLLMNSNLFGCGLNLQCTTDIVFLHKTETELEKQIIGRAQRLGRKENLNIWHLMHQNENIIYTKKSKINDFDINFINNSENNQNFSINSSLFSGNEILINDNIEYYDSQFDNYMNIE
jgi:hypothetical protein